MPNVGGRLAFALVAALLLSTGLSAGEPERVEYAVRWDPTQGGPANVRELLSLLGASDEDAHVYEVSYFDFPRPAGAPPDATPILRLRTPDRHGKAEVRLKYRTDQALRDAWSCPDGARFKKSEQLDVVFGSSDKPARLYAYSCSAAAKAPPDSLGAAPKSCAARMVRYEHGGDKIEEWTLPGGAIRLEVSRTTAAGAKHEAKFGELVHRLRARGVKPLDESKTELGSRCPETKP
jgi:hypothetical protein